MLGLFTSNKSAPLEENGQGENVDPKRVPLGPPKFGLLRVRRTGNGEVPHGVTLGPHVERAQFSKVQVSCGFL